MPKGLPSNAIIAEVMARKIFAQRGNHSEAHLSERELAAIIDAALGLRDTLVKNLEAVQ